MIERLALSGTREQSDRKPYQHDEDDRRRRELDRGGQELPQVVEHRTAVGQGHAEIASEQTSHIDPELRGDRFVESVTLGDFPDLVTRRVLPRHQTRRISGDEMGEREGDHGDAEQHENKEQQPLEDEPDHTRVPVKRLLSSHQALLLLRL